MDKEQLKKRVCEAIRKNFAETQALGHSIFTEPELGFKEGSGAPPRRHFLREKQQFF